jgi:uncharacterized protein YjiS (DUF1127 family)
MTHFTIATATSAGVPPAREVQAPIKKRTTVGRRPDQADPCLLREDHFLCVIMDAVLAVQAAVKRWLHRRRGRQELVAVDEHPSRDIGLTRDAAKRLAHHESKGQSSHVPTSAIFFAGR